MTSFWTDERSERCRDMWAAGHTASQIGNELGCSRNAVLSRIHRKGYRGPNMFSERRARAMRHVPSNGSNGNAVSAKPNGQRAPRQRPPRPRPVVQEAGIELDAYTPSEAAMRSFASWCGPAMSLAELGPNDCRWPVGDPAQPDFCFCAAPVGGGTYRYCVNHNRIAVDIPRRRKTSGASDDG